MAARINADFSRTTTLILVASLLQATLSDEVTWTSCWTIAAYRGRATRGPDDYATTLNLIGCRIKKLELNSFDDTRNLEEINLNGNQLEQIDHAVFQHVTNLTELDISNNNLADVPVCREYQFPRLKKLYILANRIPALYNNTFCTCDLERIDVSYNIIEHIHEDTFKRMHNLRSLMLNNNKIKILPETVFQIQSLQALHLHNNFIEYIPLSVFGRNVSLQWIFLHGNKINFLPENFVSELNKAGANIESFTFYDNVWHCPCLIEQFADLKRSGVSVYEMFSWKYDGKNPACVFFGRQACHRHPPASLLPSQQTISR